MANEIFVTIGAKFQSDMNAQLGSVQKKGMAAQNSMNGLGRAAFFAGFGLKQMGREMLTAGMALGSLAVMAAKAFADFEDAVMTTGATAQLTSEQYKEMGTVILDLARSTVFTANEIGKATVVLAQAGLAFDEIKFAIKGVTQLSTAFATDLESTSKAVVQTIRQFGLEFSETERVVNLFAAAATSSRLTVKTLGQAMSNVGPVAKVLGVSLETVTAILGHMANVGIDGTKSGRQLRIMMLRLATAMPHTSSKKINDALKDLTLTFNDINPATNDFIDILLKLKKANIGASEASVLFRQRAAATGLSLVENAEKIAELRDRITGTQRAYEVFGLRMVTLTAKAEIFKDSIIALGVSIGKLLEGGIKVIVDKGTDFVKGLIENDEQVKNITESIIKWTGALVGGGGLLIAVGSLIGFMAILSVMGAPIWAAFLALAGIFGAASWAGNKLSESILGVSNAFEESQTKIKQDLMATDRLINEYEILRGKADSSRGAQKKLKEITDELKETYPELVEQINEFAEGLRKGSEFQKDVFNEATRKSIEAHTKKIKELNDELNRQEESNIVWRGMLAIFDEAKEKAEEGSNFISKKFQQIQGNVKKSIDEGGKLHFLTEANEALESWYKNLVTGGDRFKKDVADPIKTEIDVLKGKIEDLNETSSLKEFVEEAKKAPMTLNEIKALTDQIDTNLKSWEIPVSDTTKKLDDLKREFDDAVASNLASQKLLDDQLKNSKAGLISLTTDQILATEEGATKNKVALEQITEAYRRMVADTHGLNREFKMDFMSLTGDMVDFWTDAIDGMITKTKTWQDVWQDILTQARRFFIQSFLQIIFNKWRETMGAMQTGGSGGSWVDILLKSIGMFAGIKGGGTPATTSNAASASYFSNLQRSDVGFASGGIATAPTAGIFGEAGPEALIPLDRLNEFTGAKTQEITVVNVIDPSFVPASIVKDPRVIINIINQDLIEAGSTRRTLRRSQ